MITFQQAFDWAEAELSDALKWHEAQGHFKSDAQREAYKAGFMQGWHKLRAMEVLHGGIEREKQALRVYPLNGV